MYIDPWVFWSPLNSGCALHEYVARCVCGLQGCVLVPKDAAGCAQELSFLLSLSINCLSRTKLRSLHLLSKYAYVTQPPFLFRVGPGLPASSATRLTSRSSGGKPAPTSQQSLISGSGELSSQPKDSSSIPPQGTRAYGRYKLNTVAT